MTLFDPGDCKPLPAEFSIVNARSQKWRDKWPNWWAGATIASPTTQMVIPAKQTLSTLHELASDIAAINEFYLHETEYARVLVRNVLQCEEATPVIFDASGTAAILTASRMFAHIAGKSCDRFWTWTTGEGGSLVPMTLLGGNPYEVESVMFQPLTSTYYDPCPVISYPALTVSSALVNPGNKTDAEIIESIERIIEASDSPGCIVLPHVTKTGRILPVRQVGALVAAARKTGKQVYLIVDDVQGIGRMPAEANASPLSFCDAYVFASSKALGGILIASAIVIKPEHVSAFLETIKTKDNLQPWFSHFQFSTTWEQQLPAECLKPGAVSLPELASMRAGLTQLYVRGDGSTFAQRRQHTLKQIDKRRERLGEALRHIPGLQILESSPGRSFVPSIVCFQVEGSNLSPFAIKETLQKGDPIVTPSASIGRYVRLDIPEYREMPSLDVLVKQLKEALALQVVVTR